MTFDPLAPLPLATTGLSGIGGRIKAQPEDFEVEEVPAYAPSGQGDFLYLWVQKRGLGAEFFVRTLSRKLDLPVGEIGTAGLKDRHAVTRQMVSVPARVETRLDQVNGDGIELLTVHRHSNKLKPGHLRGNRFRILVREVNPLASERLPILLERLGQVGLPNFYGEQRFGRDGETVHQGLGMLRNDPAAMRRRLNPFLRKLALSAAQSALFNHNLACRMRDDTWRRVLPGEVMAKWPFGGMFVTDDVPREQGRLEAREIVGAGPMFGRKMFPAAGEAAAREERVLSEASLTPASFNGFGKLLAGTRRHNIVYPDGLSGTVEAEGVRLEFFLPAGSYATVLLREVMQTDVEGEEV